MSIIDKYIKALEDERREMSSYVQNTAAKVTVPESAVTVTTIPSTRHTAVSSLCLAGGALAIIAGLCMEKSGVSVAGGIAVACGAGMMAIDRSSKETVQREVAFYKVTSHYYKSLSDIYKYVSNHWTDKLVELKSSLKADIMKLDLPEQKKNEVVQKVLTTSVVDMAMTEMSAKLGKIERAKDEQGYVQFANVFAKDCIEAINNAFEEQKSVYERLNGVV